MRIFAQPLLARLVLAIYLAAELGAHALHHHVHHAGCAEVGHAQACELHSHDNTHSHNHAHPHDHGHGHPHRHPSAKLAKGETAVSQGHSVLADTDCAACRFLSLASWSVSATPPEFSQPATATACLPLPLGPNLTPQRAVLARGPPTGPDCQGNSIQA